MKLLSKVISFVMLLALLAGCMVAPNAPQVQPDAGQWKTWVLTSSSEFRPPAPPDQAATQAELKQVQDAIAGRTDADLQTIAYWDSGAPNYRWIEAAFDQNRPKPASGPRVTRMMSLLNVAIYDAMVA